MQVQQLQNTSRSLLGNIVWWPRWIESRRKTSIAWTLIPSELNSMNWCDRQIYVELSLRVYFSHEMSVLLLWWIEKSKDIRCSQTSSTTKAASNSWMCCLWSLRAIVVRKGGKDSTTKVRHNTQIIITQKLTHTLHAVFEKKVENLTWWICGSNQT